MLEVENENQAGQSDVNEGSSSSNAESQQAVTSSQEGVTQQSTESESQYVPYSRFKELVEQRNQTQSEMASYKQNLAQMQYELQRMREESRQASQPKTENPLLARLKGIDPEFGGAFESVFNRANQVEMLQKRLEQYEMQAIREKGLNTVNSLHSEYKVPKELHDFYNSAIESKVRSMPNVGLDDLPSIYKSVHDQFSKFMEAQKRSTTESYVADKKASASVPTQAKGQPIKSGNKFEYSKNPDEARKQLVNNVMKAMKGDKSL